MKLQEIFNQLSYGELSNVFIGSLDKQGIQPEHYKQLISHLNLGLNNLFKRFPLKEGELILKLTEGIYTYPLKKDFAENNLKSVEDNLYILDGEDKPFEGDIIKVERVYLESGVELPLNDEHADYSIFTPNLYTIRVPHLLVDKPDSLDEQLRTDTLKIIYRATHPFIEYKDNLDPNKVEVDLPYSHLEALLYFIASRVNNPIGLQNDFHAGNMYASKYEKECQLLEMQNIRVDQGVITNTRLYRNGWV